MTDSGVDIGTVASSVGFLDHAERYQTFRCGGESFG